jgi:TatA/E family protein of Tat protein translocase
MGIENPVHLMFLAAVALIVLGPKRLPELARAAGKGMREFRESLNGETITGEAFGGSAVEQPVAQQTPLAQQVSPPMQQASPAQPAPLARQAAPAQQAPPAPLAQQAPPAPLEQPQFAPAAQNGEPAASAAPDPPGPA